MVQLVGCAGMATGIWNAVRIRAYAAIGSRKGWSVAVSGWPPVPDGGCEHWGGLKGVLWLEICVEVVV